MADVPLPFMLSTLKHNELQVLSYLSKTIHERIALLHTHRADLDAALVALKRLDDPRVPPDDKPSLTETLHRVLATQRSVNHYIPYKATQWHFAAMVMAFQHAIAQMTTRHSPSHSHTHSPDSDSTHTYTQAHDALVHARVLAVNRALASFVDSAHGLCAASLGRVGVLEKEVAAAMGRVDACMGMESLPV
ncbi:uncharacterized protein EHS24_007637 [Apiotrichum porosum]|uniref:Uncharacterized protein n=1 Tax=Apiotrichum porosum TaxID=105984 RepID=A0A427XUW2_9TREE|nr:uncharacterized protein EHS24_007637 [Apiotrichum porosum]RSH82644.1 hypothetical protein EHS24_007637 [Apiotrichum porosum]